MATGSYMTPIYSRSQSEVQGDLHNGAQRINPENRVGSSFRIIPEQYFSGVENIDDFLEKIDHNLAYYEIPAQLACAYLKVHLKGRALDWFEVLGYRVIEDKTTDYVHLKQALSEQFPVVRNRSELETRFYSSSQRRDQQPSDFIYELLKIHKVLKLEMSEEKLIDHVVSLLEPQILDYVEVRHPRNTANLLQIVDKYEERFMHRQIRGSSEGFRSSGPNEGNRFNTRHRQENWRENGNNERYANNSRPQRELNRFENQGFANNRRFEGRRQGGQSEQRFHNQGGRQRLFSDQPGLTHVLYHEIDTGDKGPVVSRPYRYDRVKQGIIDYHIDKLLRDGTICPINSPYASPVVLTRKKNDLPPDSPEAYRFAIDYRKLNGITKYPRYPLPVIDDLLTNIPHTNVMSTLDLRSGYFQLAISPRDIEKTAFITRNGTFAFLRMPFGLSGAAPNFQRAIDIILKPVIGRFVLVYMDDVIITSPSFKDHLDHLSQVFTLLRDAGLTLNKEKCHFARDKLKYLGLIISKEGIETDNKKIRAITEMKPPKNN
ncbi:retrovirus-related Pol polyprotein from transposon opus [Trichonephila clavipes]|nr:retrovirus-related Pol polyprotein from transposon opus [Trichonephila clavipes]